MCIFNISTNLGLSLVHFWGEREAIVLIYLYLMAVRGTETRAAATLSARATAELRLCPPPTVLELSIQVEII